MLISGMQAKTVLVLGGGVGGIVAANHLRRRLPRQHRVILVDRERAHLCQPSLLWLAVGDRTPASIQRPLERLLQKGIEVITGEITEIDPTTRTIRAGGQDVSGETLIVALGADLAPDAIPGLAAAGHNLDTLEGATTFRGALAACRGGRIVVLTAAPAYKCPAASYEVIMLVEAAMRRRGTRGECVLDLYAAEAGPMGVAGPHVSAAVRSVVESKGISYHPLHQVVTVDPAGRRLAFANGATAEFDLLAYVPPHRVPAVVGASGLVDESGWVPVNRETFERRFQGVYAIRDVTTVPLTIGKPLPKAGVFAHGRAEGGRVEYSLAVDGSWLETNMSRGGPVLPRDRRRPVGVGGRQLLRRADAGRDAASSELVVALGQGAVRTPLAEAVDLNP